MILTIIPAPPGFQAIYFDDETYSSHWFAPIIAVGVNGGSAVYFDAAGTSGMPVLLPCGMVYASYEYFRSIESFVNYLNKNKPASDATLSGL